MIEQGYITRSRPMVAKTREGLFIQSQKKGASKEAWMHQIQTNKNYYYDQTRKKRQAGVYHLPHNRN